MADYRTEAPQILRDFLSYHETIKAHSKRTVDEYFLDLRNFFRYLKQTRDPSLCDRSLDEIDQLEKSSDSAHTQGFSQQSCQLSAQTVRLNAAKAAKSTRDRSARRVY